MTDSSTFVSTYMKNPLLQKYSMKSPTPLFLSLKTVSVAPPQCPDPPRCFLYRNSSPLWYSTLCLFAFLSHSIVRFLRPEILFRFFLAFLELSTIPLNGRCLKDFFARWMECFNALPVKQTWKVLSPASGGSHLVERM